MIDENIMKQNEERIASYDIPKSLGTKHAWILQIEQEHKKIITKFDEKWDKKLHEMNERFQILQNEVRDILESNKTFKEKNDKLLKRADNALKDSKLTQSSDSDAHDISNETIQLKKEILDKSQIIESLNKKVILLKGNVVELKDEVVSLKKENDTLKSQIVYLWDLIKTYLATQFTALAKNFHAFFSKKKEYLVVSSHKEENTTQCDM